MSSTAARLFLSKTFGKVILPDYSVAKSSLNAQRRLHTLCRSLVTVSLDNKNDEDIRHLNGCRHHYNKSNSNNNVNSYITNSGDSCATTTASHGFQQRRQLHTSASRGVVFKSKYQTDMPKQDFFSYVLGDIRGYEDETALVCGLTGRKYTYEKLKDYCTRVGISMLERGYRKGDVVAIYSPNVPEYVFTILGTYSGAPLEPTR